jgi:DNA-binding SARP family transcriptional activator
MAKPQAAMSAAFSLNPPILICLLGTFRVVKCGHDVSIARGSKIETFLTYLALRHREAITRELLLNTLWPDYDAAHAGQSLNSLVYSVQKLFEDKHAGVTPVVQANGYYRLNENAGVSVDVALFSAQVDLGDKLVREGESTGAAQSYERAMAYYHGDLCASSDVNALLEREYLRARYLGVLAWLADYHFALRNYQDAHQYARLLLASDACREDAHRLTMRCYVRSGQRAQALRQYQLCKAILLDEFDAQPEAATTMLYEQVRLDPGAI